jgi:8-oxo-dGTP diphosphatase
VEFWDIVDKNGNKTGRLYEKGNSMQKGEYHLAVSVWIINTRGEFLI